MVYPVVAARAGYRCEYCRTPEQAVGYRLELDHIIPASLGGETSAENLALACIQCNRAKSARTQALDPRTGRPPLFNPRRQRWYDHFRWSATYRSIFGKTDVGRATVAALRMNDRYRRRARVHWRRLGLIP
ncbi:MAG: HNH endonuclease [Chloroflexi bacterium]|nr:HNH endonuclease [Chloroflexota bacterium]